MNFRRGFKRLFFVLGTIYYLSAALWTYSTWTENVSAHEVNLSRCLETVRYPVPSAVRYTKEDCLKIWPAPSEEWHTMTVGGWSVVIVIVTLPAILYGLWKLLTWIGRGFRIDNPVSN